MYGLSKNLIKYFIVFKIRKLTFLTNYYLINGFLHFAFLKFDFLQYFNYYKIK